MKSIAIAGNPNSGKSSLFNELTGADQYVGNWPGVTVERKSGLLRDSPDIELIDLPGIYSLSPYTPEELVTREYLMGSAPDLIVNIIDASNLERNLYLTSQILELGIPTIIALNMMDIARKQRTHIDTAALSKELGCPVIEISALKREGIKQLAQLMRADIPAVPNTLTYKESLEQAIRATCTELGCTRLVALKLLQSDHPLLLSHGITGEKHIFIEKQILATETAESDDIASIIASERYAAIEKLLDGKLQKSETTPNMSSKIDSLLTHRFFGFFIFAAIMWCIYTIAISSVGDWATGWANDVVFGGIVMEWLGGFLGTGHVSIEALTMLSALLSMCLLFPSTLRRLHDLNLNGSWLYLALAPFLLEYMCPPLPGALHSIVMYALYAANAIILALCIFAPGKKKTNDYGQSPTRIYLSPMRLMRRSNRREYILNLIIMSALATGIAMLGRLGLNCSEQLQSLFADGIVGGVGAVLGFLPQMAILFLLLSILEDCGYMARVAFMMDRIFRTIGLSGKSFIPLLISMGCGIPGVMATRTIENERDRRMTIMLTTFMPCGAKLPIIALFAMLLGDASIATIAYFASIGSVILGGVILRKSHLFAGGYTPFVMELPPYHMPVAGNINLRAMERCKAFVQKAGSVIFVSSALIWFTSSYSWKMDYLAGEKIEQSMLADIGGIIAPIFSPLGWGDWKPAVASVTGLVAKEQVLGTFGVLYPAPAKPNTISEEASSDEEESGLTRTASLPKYNALTAPSMLFWQFDSEVQAPIPAAAEEAEEEDETIGVVAGILAANAFPSFAAALSFMLFNLLCAPCFAACGAIRREMNSARWTGLAIGFMCTWAYMIAFLFYQFGSWIAGATFATGQAVACVIALGLIYRLLKRPSSEKD